ncbi:MAG TPA: NADPH:quinone oxidoreductase family protein [Terriglobales bacterium]|nr:NADPH:quinone oxidoreductase family protein [Terriglobales bacterium]
MKAILATRSGGPEVLELQDVPDPQPKPGEVLVRVEAAGVNFADTMMTQGLYPGGSQPPYIPGLEFAGVVEDTGEKVIGFVPKGAYAERISARREGLLPWPERLSAAEAAAFPINYFTAYFAYWMADAKENERVLIHAAAGGVGTAAVELGRLFGVETFGTSSSDEKLARLKELGLDHGINYKNADYEQAIMEITGGGGVDIVFEMLGGAHTAKSTRCLRPLGRMIVYGTAAGQAPQFDFPAMFQRNASVHALWLTPLFQHREHMAQAWEDMRPWLEEGKLRPIVGHQLPLVQAAEAHRMMLERKNFGKIVLAP